MLSDPEVGLAEVAAELSELLVLCFCGVGVAEAVVEVDDDEEDDGVVDALLCCVIEALVEGIVGEGEGD